MRVNIIGGGLAGCALAYVLKQRGAEPVIYEAAGAVASGASGNEVGLYNPRFTAQLDAVGAFYSAAYFKALEVFEALGDEVDWSPCGALHLMNNDVKARRYPKTVESWGWPEEEMRIVDAREASSLAGVDVDKDCLYLSRSGTVSPRKLCQAYVEGVEVRLNSPVDKLCDLRGETVVIACGMGALGYAEAAHLPLKPVRGQLSYAQASDVSLGLRTALCYGGYISAPNADGVHAVGATFQRWLEHSDVISEDDLSNLKGVQDAVSLSLVACVETKSRAGVRCSTKDHFPVVGQLSEGVFSSIGHGSHGVLSSLLSANILSDMFLGDNVSVSDSVLEALSPVRFFKS